MEGLWLPTTQTCGGRATPYTTISITRRMVEMVWTCLLEVKPYLISQLVHPRPRLDQGLVRSLKETWMQLLDCLSKTKLEDWRKLGRVTVRS